MLTVVRNILNYFVNIGGVVDHHCLEVIVCFVDIGGIDDYHCLNFLFITS
jgi:hypothetical protein